MTNKTHPIMARIKCAEQDKDRQAIWIDEILRLGFPTQRRIRDRSDPATRTQDQNDLFDTTLQTVIEDFASDMGSTFTPRHERWVKIEPAQGLSEGQQREISPQLQAIADLIFGEIEKSNYQAIVPECFSHWAVSRMMVAITDRGPTEPIHFQVVEIADQIVERGPDGSATGRWRKMRLKGGDLHVMWPDLFPALAETDGKYKKVSTVYEGIDRDWSTPGEEVWNYRIFVDGKEAKNRVDVGPGSAAFVTCQFKAQADTAWGPGPAHKATAPARVLDELAYLNLKAIQRSVDPTVSYEEDGLTNPEGGVGPGDWLPRSSGSKAPEAIKIDTRFDAMVFDMDAKREEVRKALYQDRPDQNGKTPPTATQWNDERVWQTRRRELPRDICVQEWVLPIIERVSWILRQRGALPEVKLQGGDVVTVSPVSPLSKAKDLEDVQVTMQVVNIAVQLGNAQASGIPVNSIETLNNVKRTLGERNLVMMTEEQVAAAAAAQAQAQGAPSE